MIVEIAKDNKTDNRRKRFGWNETIPVEVSNSPKILLKWKKLKYAHALFGPQDWSAIYGYIAQNRYVIQKHWTGEFGTFDLFEALKPTIKRFSKGD